MALTPNDLALMRSDQSLLSMPFTAEIKRNVTTGTSRTNRPTTTLVSIASVPCGLAKDSGGSSDNLIAGRKAEVNMYKLTVPYLTDLRVSDKVFINDKTYEVQNVWVDHHNQSAVRASVSKEGN